MSIDTFADHSRMSPSSMERIAHCPGSVREAAEYGLFISNYANELGTKAHHLAHVCLTDTPNTNYYTRHPMPIRKGDAPELNTTVDEEMAEYIQGYVDYVRNIYNSLLRTVAGGEKSLVEFQIENQIGATDMHKEAYGTSDAGVGVHFGPLHIIDLKYGVAPVSPVDNKQLKDYAWFFLHNFGDFNPIYLEIYQPRISRKSPVRTWKTSSRYIRQWAFESVRLRKSAEHPDAKLAEGPGCFFCPAQHGCPLKVARRMDTAAELFGDETIDLDDDFQF